MIHDMIIVGGGCAGLGASIYARRFNMDVLVLTDMLGGTITKTHLVENYPGFTALTGQELANQLIEHAKANDVEIKTGSRVTQITKEGNLFKVQFGKDIYETYTVLLATGTTYRKLGVAGEKEFASKGVSYCATCDAGFFKGKKTIMVGGGDSAIKEALVLSEHAAEVTVVYRGDTITKAEPINMKRMQAKDNIKVQLKTNVLEFLGDNVLRQVKLDNGEVWDIEGAFIEIGRIPLVDMVDGLGVKQNEKGEIIVNVMSETNIPGFYAAGDITDIEWKQAIVGVAQGTKAAYKAFEYVAAMKI